MRFFSQGYCPICEAPREFLAKREDELSDRAAAVWLRIALTCTTCRAPPRERIIAGALQTLCPDWRQKAIHECSPGGWAFSYKLRRECPGPLAELVPIEEPIRALGKPRTPPRRSSIRRRKRPRLL